MQLFFGIIALLLVYFIVMQYIRHKKDAPTPQVTTPSVQQTQTPHETTNTVSQTPKQEQHTVSAPTTPVPVPKVDSTPKQVTKHTPARTHKRKKEEPFQLKITQRESLYNMLVAYKDKKTYKTAIKIAQFYFLQKEYEKAVKWAVEASKKDPSQAQSWIIYAKAKKALGKREVAKRALTIFLKHNYSQSAQDLLDSL